MLERKNHVSHFHAELYLCQLTRNTCIVIVLFCGNRMMVFSTAVCIGERHAHNDSKMTCTQHSKSKHSIQYSDQPFLLRT